MQDKKYIRTLCFVILAVVPMLCSAQSIADLARKAEQEKGPLHKYSSIDSYHNGLTIVRKDNEEEETYAYGVVNEEGTVYIPAEYDQIEFIKEGSAYQDNVYKCYKEYGWGFINANDQILLPCEYPKLSHVMDGIWQTRKNGKYGYVRLNGTNSVTTLIPCIYESLGSYTTKHPIRAKYNGKESMIDCDNKVIGCTIYLLTSQ